MPAERLRAVHGDLDGLGKVDDVRRQQQRELADAARLRLECVAVALDIDATRRLSDEAAGTGCILSPS